MTTWSGKICSLRLLAVLVIAATTHASVFVAAPYVIMHITMQRLIERAGGVNKPFSTLPPTDAFRDIVKPSPDLVYTLCVYDVSGGPVLVSGATVSDYWSASLYAANSDNVFIVSPRQGNDPTNGKPAAFVIARKAQQAAMAAEHKALPAVDPPSNRGIVLFRYLNADAASFARAQEAQRSVLCRQL